MGIHQPPDSTPDGPKYLLRAVGCAFDTRVARVVGTTSEGARATAVPVNGFWFMEVSAKRPDVTWRSINALNRWGLLVHKYSPNPWDVPPGCPT